MARHRRAERTGDHKKERLTPVRAPRIVLHFVLQMRTSARKSKAAETAITLFLNGMAEREGFSI